MDIYSLPEPLQKLINDELARGEQVRWAGQPVPRAGLSCSMLAPFFFGIPFTGFALFWIAMASGIFDQRGGQLQGGRLIFALFGVPFVLAGLAMLLSPFWMRAHMRRAAAGTVYVITDQRAIVFDAGYFGDRGPMMMIGMIRPFGRGMRVTSYTPDQLTKIERVQEPDGSGHLVFGEMLYLATQPRMVTTAMPRAGFYSVPDVKEAEMHLRALAATAQPPQS